MDMNAVLRMSEGNPGGMTVLMKLAASPNGDSRVSKLDDLGHRGPFLWLIYKDLLGQNLGKMGNLLDNNQLEDEIERRIQSDERFAREWKYHKENY